eukprot:33357-Prymnesium_polylepis.2
MATVVVIIARASNYLDYRRRRLSWSSPGSGCWRASRSPGSGQSGPRARGSSSACWSPSLPPGRPPTRRPGHIRGQSGQKLPH